MRPACRGEVAHAAAAATHLHEGERGGMEDLGEQLWNRGGEEEGEVSPDPVAEVTRLGKGHLPSGAVAGEEEDTTRQGRSLRPTRRGAPVLRPLAWPVPERWRRRVAWRRPCKGSRRAHGAARASAAAPPGRPASVVLGRGCRRGTRCRPCWGGHGARDRASLVQGDAKGAAGLGGAPAGGRGKKGRRRDRPESCTEGERKEAGKIFQCTTEEQKQRKAKKSPQEAVATDSEREVAADGIRWKRYETSDGRSDGRY